jgi:hypothetical protein
MLFSMKTHKRRGYEGRQQNSQTSRNLARNNVTSIVATH